MKPNISKVRKEYFPKDDCVIMVESSKKRIKEDLNSKASCHWGQGELKDTGYFLLAQYSPQHKGDKSLIVIAKTNIVRGIK